MVVRKFKQKKQDKKGGGMSKASKTRAKQKNKKDKKARKEAKQTLYESYKRQGNNTKSRRSKTKIKRVGPRKRIHPTGRCGNPGCIKCYGVFYGPFLKDGRPNKMPNWMWKRWMKEQTT